MTDTPPPSLPRSSGLPPWMPLLVVAVAWLAQGAVLRNGWVWDDAIVVRDDPTIARGLAAVPELLVGRWGGRADDVGLFRPLVNATLAVESAIHGVSSPFPFHLTNLFLHGAVAVLLLAALHRLLPGRPVVASTAALLFAVHPLHTGTVSWIVARGDLLAAGFLLLAVLAWTRPRGLDAPAVALAALAWLAALLSKEMAIGLPIALLVIDVARLGGLRRALRTRWPAYAALVVPFVAWAWLRAGALDGLSMTTLNAPLASRDPVERVLVGCGALVRTAYKVLVPVGLSGDGMDDPVLTRGALLPAAYAVAALLVALAVVLPLVRRALGRAGAGDAALLLFVLLSLPVLQLVPIGAVFEDRFGYVPSLAGLVVVGIGVERLVSSRPFGLAPRVLASGACVVALAAAVPACWAVAADWRDDEAFSRALLRDDPGHVRALTRLGRHLVVAALSDRDVATALPVTAENRPVITARLASAAARTEEAVRLLERARSLPDGRRSAIVHWRLGDAYLALRAPRYEAAEDSYRRVLDSKLVRVGARRVPWSRVKDKTQVALPDRRDLAILFRNRALAAEGLTESERAARYTETAAEWYPSDPRDPERYRYVRQAGVLVWRHLDDPGRALPWLVEAARLAPSAERAAATADAEAARVAVRDRSKRLYDRAMAAQEAGPGRYGEALSLLAEAITVRPNFVAAYLWMARLYKYRGDYTSALAALADARAVLDQEKAQTGADADPKARAAVDELEQEIRRKQAEPEDK